MTYRLFIVALFIMIIGGGAFYLLQEKHVAYDLISNKEEKSDLLNDQIKRSVASDDTSSTANASSTAPDDAIAGEILAGNYTSDSGVEIVIKRNKKAIFVAPENPIKKGTWQIISNNVLSITFSNGKSSSSYYFSIEDPAQEIVQFRPGDTVIYLRK
jgi:hypothetical protein